MRLHGSLNQERALFTSERVAALASAAGLKSYALMMMMMMKMLMMMMMMMAHTHTHTHTPLLRGKGTIQCYKHRRGWPQGPAQPVYAYNIVMPQTGWRDQI